MSFVDELDGGRSPEQPPPTIPLSEEVTKLLIRLIAGWRPPPFRSSETGSLSWNNGEFSCTVIAANEQDDGCLILDLILAHVPFDKFLKNELRNKPCVGDLAGGKKLTAQLAHVPTMGTKTQAECFYWHTSSDGEVPRLWIAPLVVQSRRWLDLANIALDIHILGADPTAQHRTIRTVLRLNGQYDYYLLWPDDEPKTAFLIIDTLASAFPQRDVLHREFLAMQFVLGQRLRLASLAGVSQIGNVVAHTGGPYGTFHGKDVVNVPRPKSPIGDDSVEPRVARAAGQYATELFAALAAAEREHPELGLRAAMTFYLTSLGDYLEGAALKLHVALEGLASKLFDLVAQRAEVGSDLKTSKALYLTSKHADWKAWCNESAAKIRELSRPEVKDAVLDAVRRADRPGASHIVPTILRHYGIPPTSEIADVLAARNELVHEARLPSEDDFDALVQHESVPRTLLIAVIAKSAGYSGPIRGYSTPCPVWWSATEAPPGDQLLRQIVTIEVRHDEWESLANVAGSDGEAGDQGATGQDS